jgi:hypothetical protein
MSDEITPTPATDPKPAKTKPPKPEAAAPVAPEAAPVAPPPDFDAKTAQLVAPRRHEATARTVGYEQPGEGGAVHLFSPTFVFIATEPAGAPAAESKI